MERPRAGYGIQLLWGCIAPVDMPLTFFASLSVPYIVFFHRWPIVSYSNYLQGKSSVVDVIATYLFMKLGHYLYTLISAYTIKERVSVAMPEKAIIHKGILTCILLDNFCLCWLGGSSLFARYRAYGIN